MSEEEYLKARQYAKASRVQVGREVAHIPEPPRYIYTYETVKRSYPVGVTPSSAMATKLGLMEYQLAQEHEAEPQYVTVTEQVKHAVGTPPPKALASKLMQLELGILENEAPEGMFVERVERTPEGVEVTYMKTPGAEVGALEQRFLGSMMPNITQLPLIREFLEAPTEPSLGQIVTHMTGGEAPELSRIYSEAYPWTFWDVLNVAMFASLVYGAASSVTRRIVTSSLLKEHLPLSLRARFLPKAEVWEDVGLSQSYYSMSEDVYGSQQFRVEQFVKGHMLGKGMPTTPMSRTLELARGGLLSPAESIVIAEPSTLQRLEPFLTSPWTLTKTLKGLPEFALTLPGLNLLLNTELEPRAKGEAHTILTRQAITPTLERGPKQIQRLLPEQRNALASMQRLLLGSSQKQKSSQILGVSQIQRQKQLSLQLQQAGIMQKTAMKMFLPELQRHAPFYPRIKLPQLPKQRKRGFLGEAWWEKKHPIPTPRQVLGRTLEKFLPQPKRRKQRRRKHG